jgi:hypothetical protein
MTVAEVPEGHAGAQPGRLEWAAVFVLLLAHALLALGGIWLHSVSSDERTHLPAGMAAAATGEIVLNRQHPPLVKLLAGWAANTSKPNIPVDSTEYRQGREWDFGDLVLFKSGNDAETLLHRGRLPTLLISLLGGFFVYCFSRRLFGSAGGLLSLALWAFSPTVLGQDGWVTFDAPLAALGIGAVYFTWRSAKAAEETERAKRHVLYFALAAGLLLGLALAAKFSGLVFAAAVGPLCFWSLWRRLPAPPRALLPLVGQGLLSALPLFATAAVVLWGCYLFPRDPLFYLHDLSRIYADLKPDYQFYLAGEFARHFPHYFLVTFALKSTLVELAVVPLAAWASWRDPRRLELLAFVVWPALLFFVATSTMATNQGHRYILPCYPLLFVLAGVLPAFLAPRLRRSGLLLALLAGAQAVEAVAHQPDHLAYFNVFAGGARNAPFWLDDSNVDWGQELGRLPGWLDEHGIDHVRAIFMGRAAPGYYRISWEPVPVTDLSDGPRPGAYVVSAHMLVRMMRSAEKEGWKCDWLRRYEPVDILGGSLFLYVFPEPGPEPREAPAAGPSR